MSIECAICNFQETFLIIYTDQTFLPINLVQYPDLYITKVSISGRHGWVALAVMDTR